MNVYKDRADMITVYIEEAHAADEWFVHNEDDDNPILFVSLGQLVVESVMFNRNAMKIEFVLRMISSKVLDISFPYSSIQSQPITHLVPNTVHGPFVST